MLVAEGWYRPGYPTPGMRGILRRSQRARNWHFSQAPDPSVASAPQAHVSPLRHPFNLRPMLITSCQRSLAIRKVRSAKNAAFPDTIGSGKHRVPFRVAPTHSSADGAARLCSVILLSFSGPARAVSSPARAGGFRGQAGARAKDARDHVRYSKRLIEAHLWSGVTSQKISRHAACGN